MTYLQISHVINADAPKEIISIILAIQYNTVFS